MNSTHEYHRAIADMGSNGIRFTIFNIAPPHGRDMRAIYQHRAAISLYDAQYDSSGTRIPIPESTITTVVAEIQRFKRACLDFRVSNEHIYIVATEATRTALNADDFLKAILSKTGKRVRLLDHGEESRYGVMGVASSLERVDGLIIDLGGGSVQLSWVQAEAGVVKACNEAGLGWASIAYGTAELTRRMAKDASTQDLENLREELTKALKGVWTDLMKGSPEQKSINLFLSGGGLRGFGYALMARKGHSTPYPFSSVAGFEISGSDFLALAHAFSHGEALPNHKATFGVSKRRASQFPAIALLISCLSSVIPTIAHVTFVQGGVREGILFELLPPETRRQSPLTTLTNQRALASNHLQHLLISALPTPHPPIISTCIPALVSAFNVHRSYPKDSRASAALRSTTTGAYGEVNGLTHSQRAAIALLLCERWGGAVPPADETFILSLHEVLGAEVSWWCCFVGRVAALVGEVYPADRVPKVRRIQLQGIWESEGATSVFIKRESTENEIMEQATQETAQSREEKEVDGHQKMKLTITWTQVVKDTAQLHSKQVADIRKIGKKKNWVEGHGHDVEVVEVGGGEDGGNGGQGEEGVGGAEAEVKTEEDVVESIEGMEL